MSIKNEMINGVFWTSVQKYSGLVVQLIITAILARLLSPEDFGIVAIATVLIAFFTLFTDMGIGPAIIQNQKLSNNDLNNIYSFSIWGGLILSLIFFILSYVIGDIYNNFKLISICQLLSINLLFASWNIVPNALIIKNKRFKFIAKRTLFLQIISGIFSMIAAFLNFGIYSLLISPIFTSIGVFIINYKQYPMKFILFPSSISIMKIFSYSSYQFLFNFINYFSRNLDKLIIGKYFSMNELGYYEKSYRLMMLPLQNITNVVTPVMHPILTQLQSNYSELSNKYNKIINIIATISFPIGILIFFTADNIINIVYGSNWNQAIPVFKILSLSLPLQMILSTTGAIYQATGKTNWLFYGGLSNTICTVSGFLIASFFFRNIEAMAWAWNITLVINTIISYFILYKIVLRTSIISFIKNFYFPIILAILLFITLYFIKNNFLFNSHIISLITISFISLTITLFILHITKQVDIIYLIKNLKKAKK